MKDIQKIKEFFSRSLNETVDMAELEMTLKRTKKENPDKKVTYFFTKDDPKGYKIQIKENVKETTFKVGDKVTYLGHPAEITKINKEMTGATTYNVSYDKGTGKTKATNIYNKDSEIKPLKEGNEEYYKPKIRKDKNNPNFLYIDIAYPAGSGVTTALGSKTMSGRDREEGAAKALSVGNAVVKKLEAKYNIEDIDVSDGKNGKVTVFAVSDDFIKMASPSLNENFPGPGEIVDAKDLNNAMLDYFDRTNKILSIDTKTKKGIRGSVGKMYNDLVFNGDDIKLKDIVSVKIIESSLNEANGFKSGKEFINIKLQKYPKAVAKINQLINMVGESNFTMEMAEWLFDFFNNASFESPINEAKKEDKVDTITMDVPLFIRMLEYSREDAAEDMDLHDVTEKAISLGKERGILQMEDYDEIVGTAEDAPKGEMNEDESIKVGDIVSKKYASTEEDYTKEFKVINITGMSATLQDTKTGKKVGIALSDLTKTPMKEATTDYSKRRQAQDDYAVNKKDKPSKPYNPTPSGKTDYMKRRQKEIAEAIIAKLKK